MAQTTRPCEECGRQFTTAEPLDEVVCVACIAAEPILEAERKMASAKRARIARAERIAALVYGRTQPTAPHLQVIGIDGSKPIYRLGSARQVEYTDGHLQYMRERLARRRPELFPKG